MRKIFFGFTFIVTMALSKSAVTQHQIQYTPSVDLEQKANELLEQENYKEAIKVLEQVNENDTAYGWLNLKLMLSYANDSNYRAAVDRGLKGLQLNSPYYYRYLKGVSNYYSELKMHDSAMVYMTQLEKLYPYNAETYFYKGLAYLNKGDQHNSVEMYQKSIVMNPIYAPAHRNLGYLCLSNKHIVPAVLSLSTYILLKGEETGSLGSLASLERLFKNELTWDEDSIKPMYKEGNNFEEIEQLITSQIALQKNYKSRVDLSYNNFIKPMQLVVEKLEYDANDKGFWMQNYVPFFVEIRKRNMIEPFLLCMFQAVDDADVKRQITKNKTAINNFINFASDYFNNKRNKLSMIFDGKEVTKDVVYYDNGALKYAGKLSGNKFIGPIITYYSNNNVQSEGELDNSEEKTGQWKFYHENGKLKEVSQFKNGEAQGKYQQYNERGVLIEEGNLVNGKLDDRLIFYYACGAMWRNIAVKAGERNGLSTDYYSNGNKKSEREFKDNELNGRQMNFYYNGRTKDSCYAKGGKFEGKYVGYDVMGRPLVTGQFANDNRTGDWKWYHRNGKLREEATYYNGKLTGPGKKYHDNGRPEEEYVNVNDKLDGPTKEYTREGKLISELVYRKGKVMSYKYYDESGKLLYEDKEDKNIMNFKGYFPSGVLAGDGKIINDFSQGEWKYYYASGVISSLLNYKDNELDGQQTYYHQNGKTKKTITYVNGEGEGLVKTYHQNGKLHEQYFLRGNTVVGPYEAYYSNGELSRTRYYNDGEINGREVNYNTDGSKADYTDYDNGFMIASGEYDTLGNVLCHVNFKTDSDKFNTIHLNGKPKWQSSYRNGLLHGPNKFLTPMGGVSFEGNFVNGNRHGKYKKYFYNGKIRDELEFDNGQQTGKKTSYYFEGGLSSVYNYEDDETVDGFVWYNASGKKEYEGQFRDGESDGYFYIYSIDETVIARLKYNNDAVESYSYLDKDKNYVPEIPLIKLSGKVVTYFPNGKKSMECEYKNGLLQGVKITYNESGKVLEEKNYVDDWLQDHYKEYYANGNIRFDSQYLDDRKNGIIKYYSDKGVLVREETFLLGQQHGVTKWYNATTGVLEKTFNFVYDEPYEVPNASKTVKPLPKPTPVKN